MNDINLIRDYLTLMKNFLQAKVITNICSAILYAHKVTLHASIVKFY